MKMGTMVKGMIYKDIITRGTGKAFYVEVNTYGLGIRCDRVWIPRSICKVGEPNDVGYCKIEIPTWFFKNARVDYNRVVDIQINDIAYKG